MQNGQTAIIDLSQEETLKSDELTHSVGKTIKICVAHSHYKIIKGNR
jgi:hypothetical protein